jgi:hypothetical protein
MKHSPALRVWQEIHSYLNEADFGWQVLVLGACLLLALFGERLLRSHRPADGRAWELGHGGLQRIAFPLLALLLVLLARAAGAGVDQRRPVRRGDSAAGLAGGDPRGVLRAAREPGRRHLAGLVRARVCRCWCGPSSPCTSSACCPT